MNDIFKDMQAKVGCEYISDLPSYKRKAWQEMKRLNPADYEERQLEDLSKYVFGMSYQTLNSQKQVHFSDNLKFYSSHRIQTDTNDHLLLPDTTAPPCAISSRASIPARIPS